MKEPALHISYRISCNSLTFDEALPIVRSSDLEESDAIGETLLFKAVNNADARLGVVRQLVKMEANVNHKNIYGQTVVMRAVSLGRLDIVRYLSNNGADTSLGDFHSPYRNCLCLAIMYNHLDIVEYLLAKQTRTLLYDQKAYTGDDVLLEAASYADTTTLKLLTRVRWITIDLDSLINRIPLDGLTPYNRVWGRTKYNQNWADCHMRDLDPDPKEIYEYFMNLIQKIIDDHYGFEESQAAENYSTPRKRMIPVHRPGTRFWDIVESDYIAPGIITSDVEDSEEESDGAETDHSEDEWEDALEAPDGNGAGD
ncbi:MAG: hypothetical protein Q9220_006371 [cf. Caloplaca sp. 1 TL-2023]